MPRLKISGDEIARALAMEPDIILADEPTGNLDTGSGSDVMSLLGALSEQGRTLIVVTHDQHLARRAHRVVEIRDGVIVSDSPTKAEGAGSR
jgi:ABC-type lipoprotein export system ATPase subunit